MTHFQTHGISCQVVNKKYYVDPHSHDSYQWYFVLSGSVEYKVDGETFTLKDFDSLLIAPGVLREPSSAELNTKYMAIQFSIPNKELPSFKYELFKMPVGMQFDLDELFKEIKSPGFKYSREYFEVLFDRVMFYVLREFWRTRNSQELTHKNEDIVHAIEQFLKFNLSNPISREDLCRITGYSSAQVARIYKKATGMTIHEKLTIYRIEAAQSFLRTSTLPITSIAMTVGFNSFSHFTQLFKDKVGLTPSEYRATS